MRVIAAYVADGSDGGEELVMVSSCRPGPDITAILALAERRDRQAGYDEAWRAWMADRLASWQAAGIKTNNMGSVTVLIGDVRAWRSALPLLEVDTGITLEPNRIAHTL